METGGGDRRSIRHPGAVQRLRRGPTGATAALIGGIAVLLVVLVGIGGWLTLRWFVHPAVVVPRPGPADAVVMFGGAGPRFSEAVRLAEAGTCLLYTSPSPRD